VVIWPLTAWTVGRKISEQNQEVNRVGT